MVETLRHQGNQPEPSVQQVKETIVKTQERTETKPWGVSIEPVQQAERQATQTIDGAKGVGTWMATKAGLIDPPEALEGQTKFVKPVGLMVSEEKETVSLTRYKDRPEGIDQFGGEEIERDDVTGGSQNQFWRKVANQPKGIDQFGGEEAEHK